MLSKQQGEVLLRLARQTIQEHLGLPVLTPVTDTELADPALAAKQGVFVTLNKRGQLRGCIGSLVGVEPIVDGVRRHAVNAAFHDHRFTPVTAAEVDDLRIDLSILSQPRPLDVTSGDDLIARLRPGIDGLIIRDPSGAGATFLPQVWAQLPDPKQFLGHLCRKAGLAENSWRSGRLEFQTYQVQHFEENP